MCDEIFSERAKIFMQWEMYLHVILVFPIFRVENVLHGWTTYVHCKAGRGRSTTIVICYLVSTQMDFNPVITCGQVLTSFETSCIQVQHKQMTPDAAYDYVRSIRPRVLLASAQRQVLFWQDFWQSNSVRNFSNLFSSHNKCSR